MLLEFVGVFNHTAFRSALRSLSTSIVLNQTMIILVMLGFGASEVAAQHHDGHREEQSQFFIKNEGQWKDSFLFKTTVSNTTVFIEPTQITYVLTESRSHGGQERSANGSYGHAYKVIFEGARPDVLIEGHQKRTAYHNYYFGSSQEDWRSRVPLYGGIRYENLYNGIDLSMYYKGDALKYDFIVAPGASVDQIKMAYTGQDRMCITPEGHLEIATSIGSVQELQPFSYQLVSGRVVSVPCSFVLDGNEVTFSIDDSYDDSLPLIIDPELVFSTFTGSTGNNYGVTATYDSDGHGYTAGIQFATGYPTTVGPFDDSFNDGEFDISISKFSPDGSSLVYSTYLGGSGEEFPSSLVVNSQDELVLLGATSSTDFPTTPGSFDNTHNGGFFVQINVIFVDDPGLDICLVTFSPDGSSLIGSTLIGGSENDGVIEESEIAPNYGDGIRGEVITDEFDNVYVASTTESSNFPTTSGAYQSTFGGESDAVIFKFDRTLSTLQWSSYYGGTSFESATALDLDENLNVYFTGGTLGRDLDVPSSALLSMYQGGPNDGYVAALSADGTSLHAGTYLSTNADDLAYFVEVGPDGDIYVLGNETSGTYPVSPGVYNNPGSYQYIHKLDPALSTTRFSTVIGSDKLLVLNAFLVDKCGRIYLSGWGGETNSSTDIIGFPTTSDAFKAGTDGSDFYFMVLEADADALLFGSYFGADNSSTEHVDGGTSRFDTNGVVYQAICAGCGGTSDFPTTDSAWSKTNNSSDCNLALVKIDFELDELMASASLVDISGCAPFTANFENSSVGPIDSVVWIFGDGTTSNEFAPTKVYSPGSYEVKLIIHSVADCIPPDTAIINIEVSEPLPGNYDGVSICGDDVVLLEAHDQVDGSSYSWSTGDTTAEIEISTSGLYIVEVISPLGCYQDTFEVDEIPEVDSVISLSECDDGTGITLEAPLPGVSYTWDDGSSDRVRVITSSGTYSVIQTHDNGCEQTAVFNVDIGQVLSGQTFDTTSCGASTVELMAPNMDPAYNYIWSNDEIGSTIQVNSSGIYTVTTFTSEDTTKCFSIDSFIISILPQEDPVLEELLHCPGEVLRLSPPSSIFQDQVYEWDPPSDDAVLSISAPGTYRVTISDAARAECPREYIYLVELNPSGGVGSFYFPNAFSPNNDGINDEFGPLYGDDVEVIDYHLQIFNRWGGLVFESRDPMIGWSGISGTDESGAYAYVWQCTILMEGCTDGALNALDLTGEVFLIR